MINHGRGRCISFGGLGVDRAVSEVVLETLSPLGVEAALKAVDRLREKSIEVRHQRELALEQARYEAGRVRRQFDAVEPENRLVAAELESRWEEALEKVYELEREIAKLPESEISITEEEKLRLLELGQDLTFVWNHEASSPKLKKRLLRTLLKEVVVDVEDEKLKLILHWHGGEHSRLEVRKNKTGVHRWVTDKQTVTIVKELSRQMPDSDIAGLLNRLGKRTGKGNPWTEIRVRSCRATRKIPPYRRGEREERGEVTVEEAATRFQVSTSTIYRLIKKDILPAHHVCFGAPWIIKEDHLSCESVQEAIMRVKEGKGFPSSVDPRQKTLDFTGM